MNTGEARSAVRAIYGASESSAQITNIPEHADLDDLKVAEYGLLVGPITSGVEMFLEQLPHLELPPIVSDTSKIVSIVGAQIFKNTWRQIEEQDGLEGLLTELANQRAARVDNEGYMRLIAPFKETLRAASKSSANNMCFAATANAFTLQMSPEGNKLSHQEQVAITKASHGLALSHPLVHIGDMGAVTVIMNDYCSRVFMGKRFREELLEYSAEHGQVLMVKSLDKWHTDSDRTIADSNVEDMDVRIGCPFSFAPRDVRVRYYEAIVELMDGCGQWPKSFASIINT